MTVCKDAMDLLEQSNILLRSCLNRLFQSAGTQLIESNYVRRHAIEINGIPEVSNENLRNIVTQLSRIILSRMNWEDIVSAKRIKRAKPRPIVVKMRNRSVRNELIEAFHRYNLLNRYDRLNTTDLGFDGLGNHILMSKHPSPLNKIHRKEARAAAFIPEPFKSFLESRPWDNFDVFKDKEEVKSLQALTLIAINKKLAG